MNKKLVIVLCWLLALGCAKQVIMQDEQKAIITANKFLKSIMQQDYQSAYDIMSPGIKYGPKATLEYFKADWEAIRDKYGAITKATFSAWQLAPGKRAIQLYYNVVHKNVKKPVVYHMVLEGHQDMAYTLFLIDIGNEQRYPPNATTLPEKNKINEKIEIWP